MSRTVTDAVQRVRDRLVGVMVTPVTPFNGVDYSIDWNGVDESLEFLVSEGITAIVPCGSMGEFAHMEPDEREQVVARSVEQVAGRALVVAGTSDENAATALRLTRSAKEAGADAVMVKPPHYFGLTDAEVRAFYAEIDAVGVPIMAYNAPAKRQLTLDDLEYLSGLANFAALKEASSGIVETYRIIWRFGNRFPVIGGAENTLFAALLAGACGSMTATATFSPALAQALYDAVQASELTRAREVYARIWSYRELLRAKAASGHPAQLTYTKAALELLGLPAGPPRPPLQPLDDAERAALAKVLRDDMRIGPRGALLDEAAA